MPKSTIYVQGTFREGYERYFADYSLKVRTYLDKHHGEVIRRQRVMKSLYGSDSPDLMMVIDFPSAEIAEKILFEPEYLALVPLRDKVFSDFRMVVAEQGEI